MEAPKPTQLNARLKALIRPKPEIPTDRRITPQEDGKVLKTGTRVRIEEAEALKLAHGMQLPVPKVHEVQHLPNDRIGILMDMVPGQCLQDVWPAMDDGEKQDIAHQLRDILSRMRAVRPSSEVPIGACNAGVRDLRARFDYTCPPCKSEAEFNQFLLQVVKKTPPAIQTALAKSLRTDHRVVFTHGDLNMHNIIVNGGKIQGLIDWEFAGWYPEYWEYVKFFERWSDCPDWKNFAGDIFEEVYDEELVTYQAFIRWQSP